MHGLFGQNYRVATFSTFNLTVSGIIITSLKTWDNSNMHKLMN